MDRYVAPVITGFLFGLAVWIVDAVFFLYLNDGVTAMGAFLFAVPLYRLALRLVILLCAVLLGGIKGYNMYVKEHDRLGLTDDVPEEIRNFSKSIHTQRDLREREKNEKEIMKTEAKKTKRELKQAVQTDREFEAAGARGKARPARKQIMSVRDNAFGEAYPDKASSNGDMPTALWQYAGRLGEALRLTTAELKAIRNLCYCYNLGRFGVCDNEVSPDKKENSLLSHSEIAARIVETIPGLADCADLIRYHHERYDGSGLMAMAGLEIPLGSRIFAVAWVYNALTRSDGYWRLKGDEALETLYQYSGTALDPELVAAFIGMMSGGKYFVDSKAGNTVWNN